MLLVAKPRFQEWPDLELYLRGCFFAIKADLKARRYLHEFSRYYRCSLCSDSLIAIFSGAMAGVLNQNGVEIGLDLFLESSNQEMHLPSQTLLQDIPSKLQTSELQKK